MATISVNAQGQCYDITVRRGALQNLKDLLNLDRRVLVVSDNGVPEEYTAAVVAQCKEPVWVTFPQGEASKNIDIFSRILRTMLENNFTRRDCVVAVGGGVVGDISGFAAACYMRGVDFYNIPTTLLSQVDSSIGGKTAIDFDGVKNVIGAFYQPKAVVIDPNTLKTLDRRQLSAGLAESVKMAVTSDAALFELIENCNNIEDALEEIIVRSLEIKKSVVEADPMEKGLRRILNFGHTIGHAVESVAGGALLHGECVALGMLPMCAPAIRARVAGVLSKLSLKTEIEFDRDTLMPYLLHDKKMLADTVAAVFSKEIGTFEMCEIPPEDIFEWANKNL